MDAALSVVAPSTFSPRLRQVIDLLEENTNSIRSEVGSENADDVWPTYP